MQRTRNGVPGRLERNKGNPRKKLMMAARLAVRRPAFGWVLSMSKLAGGVIGLSFLLNAL
jgi:hypothetical protein